MCRISPPAPGLPVGPGRVVGQALDVRATSGRRRSTGTGPPARRPHRSAVDARPSRSRPWRPSGRRRRRSGPRTSGSRSRPRSSLRQTAGPNHGLPAPASSAPLDRSTEMSWTGQPLAQRPADAPVAAAGVAVEDEGALGGAERAAARGSWASPGARSMSGRLQRTPGRAHGLATTLTQTLDSLFAGTLARHDLAIAQRRRVTHDVHDHAPRPSTSSALRDRIHGTVIAPADPGYDEARVVVARRDRPPARGHRPGRRHRRRARGHRARPRDRPELAVRAGGPQRRRALDVVDGGIVLDVRGPRLARDRRRRPDRVGRRRADRASPTPRRPMPMTSRRASATRDPWGSPGLTLGGGIGYLVRRDGLTIDNLLAVELVTADGEVRVVDAEHEPDLFWAVRGGGGNVGVATRFHYRLHPVAEVTGGMLLLPATPAVARRCRADPDRGARGVSGDRQRDALPADAVRARVVARQGRRDGHACYAGPPDEADAGPRPGPRPRRAARRHGPPDPLPRDVPAGRPGLPPAGGREDATSSTRSTSRRRRPSSSGSPRSSVDVADARGPAAALGGAAARVPDDATAYAHRERRFMATVAAFYAGPRRSARRSRPGSTTLVQALDPVAGRLRQLRRRRGRGARPRRLSRRRRGSGWPRIKRRYDPENLFRRNQNVAARSGRLRGAGLYGSSGTAGRS